MSGAVMERWNDNIEKESLIVQEDSLDAQIQKDAGKSSGKREDIQGLRGVAIAYVLVFHLFPEQFPRGFLGVDIFFVISGYLITMILSRNENLTFTVIGKFFSKRIRRIFPVYYLVIFCVLVVGTFQMPSDALPQLQEDALWSMAFANNFQRLTQGRNYFAELIEADPTLHLWSLAVEIQFYCIAPFIVIGIKQSKLGLIFESVLLISSLGMHCMSHGTLQFSSLPSRIWQFMSGGIVFLYANSPKTGSLALAVSCVALFAISPIGLYIPLQDTAIRIVVTFASAILIAFESPIQNHILSNKYIVFVGDISYSLYLFHWPIITFFRLQEASISLTEAVVLVEFVVLVSTASYYIVEKYFTAHGLWRSIVVISVFCFASFSTFFLSDLTATGEIEILQTSNFSEEQGTFFEMHCSEFRKVPYLPAQISKSTRDSAVRQNEIFRKDAFWKSNRNFNWDPLFEKHYGKFQSRIKFPYILKGSGNTTAVIFGNSYAFAALKAVRIAFGSRFKEIRVLSTPSCEPALGLRKNCDDFVNRSVTLISELKPDVVFIVFRPQNPIFDKEHDVQCLQRTMDVIANSSRRIVLQYPFPVHKTKSVSAVLTETLKKDLALEDLKVDLRDFFQFFKSSFQAFDSLKCPKCERIFPHKIFCDSDICRVFDPENLFSFFDSDGHYNEYAHRCIGELYRQLIDEMYAHGYFQ